MNFTLSITVSNSSLKVSVKEKIGVHTNEFHIYNSSDL